MPGTWYFVMSILMLQYVPKRWPSAPRGRSYEACTCCFLRLRT
jgi:hypothetical protein